MMHGHEKSRSAIVAVKPTNKAERCPVVSSTLMDGSLDPGLPGIGRKRRPVRRATSKQKRSTIGATIEVSDCHA
jgi:hypothetical protein